MTTRTFLALRALELVRLCCRRMTTYRSPVDARKLPFPCILFSTQSPMSARQETREGHNIDISPAQEQE
jgi:hypothetical protein